MNRKKQKNKNIPFRKIPKKNFINLNKYKKKM